MFNAEKKCGYDVGVTVDKGPNESAPEWNGLFLTAVWTCKVRQRKFKLGLERKTSMGRPNAEVVHLLVSYFKTLRGSSRQLLKIKEIGRNAGLSRRFCSVCGAMQAAISGSNKRLV